LQSERESKNVPRKTRLITNHKKHKTKMSIKNFITALALTVTPFTISAQTYTGKVLDPESQPLPYANIALRTLPDSALVCGTVSDIDGVFSISCGKKADLLCISTIGYETIYLNNPSENLGTLQMREAASELGEVLISAQKPKTRLQGSSMITSIEGSVLEKSGTAKDMLAKVPGIVRGSSGLEVIGRGTPLIYINGREVRDTRELESLQSDEIKNVEVIMNPGVEFQAGVTSVVRIYTKRRKGEGWGIETEAHNSVNFKNTENNPGGSVNVNYRHNNLDIFGYVDCWSWHNYNEKEYEENTYTAGKKYTLMNESHIYTLTADSYDSWKGYGLNYKAGFNYQAGDNHSFGARVEIGNQLNDEWNNGYNTILLIDKVEEDRMKNDIYEETTYKPTYRANAYYCGKIGKLSIDYNLDLYHSYNEDRNISTELSRLEDLVVESQTNTENSIAASKLVLEYPIWKGNLKLGNEQIYVSRANEYTTNKNTIASSKSDVTEKTTAFFAEYGFAMGEHINGSAGLRYENVDYEYINKLSNQVIHTNHNNVFPVLALNSQIGKVQLALSYQAKTQRPNYWALSDAVYYVNRYTYSCGNSQLKNSVKQSVGLNAHYNIWNLSVNYQTEKDPVTEWSYLYDNENLTDEGVIIIKRINLEKPIRELVSYLNVAPTYGCWSPSLTAGICKPFLKLDVEDSRMPEGHREAKFTDPMMQFNISNTWRLAKSLQLELNGWCQTKGNGWNYRLTNNSFNMGFAVQKGFMDDNLVLRLYGENLPFHDKQNVEMDCGYYELIQHATRYQSRIGLSLRWKFNATNSKYKGQGAGEDAFNRI